MACGRLSFICVGVRTVRKYDKSRIVLVPEAFELVQDLNSYRCRFDIVVKDEWSWSDGNCIRVLGDAGFHFALLQRCKREIDRREVLQFWSNIVNKAQQLLTCAGIIEESS